MRIVAIGRLRAGQCRCLLHAQAVSTPRFQVVVVALVVGVHGAIKAVAVRVVGPHGGSLCVKQHVVTGVEAPVLFTHHPDPVLLQVIYVSIEGHYRLGHNAAAVAVQAQLPRIDAVQGHAQLIFQKSVSQFVHAAFGHGYLKYLAVGQYRLLRKAVAALGKRLRRQARLQLEAHQALVAAARAAHRHEGDHPVVAVAIALYRRSGLDRFGQIGPTLGVFGLEGFVDRIGQAHAKATVCGQGDAPAKHRALGMPVIHYAARKTVCVKEHGRCVLRFDRLRGGFPL